MNAREHAPPRNIHDVVERIRAKPAMWLGSCSVQRLFVWLAGYRLALLDVRVEEDRGEPSFDYFHTFVQKKLGFYESTSGWANMICDRVGDDSGPALDRFYELFDEFRALGPPRRIAETRDPTVITKQHGTSEFTDAHGTPTKQPRHPTHLELYRFPAPLGLFLVMRFPWGSDEQFVAGEEEAYRLAERWFGVARDGWRSTD